MENNKFYLRRDEEIIEEFGSDNFAIPFFLPRRRLAITNQRIIYWKGKNKKEIDFKEVFDILVEGKSLNIYMKGALKYDYDPNFETDEMDRPYISVNSFLRRSFAKSIACRFFTQPQHK